jgi:hypothetical protein
LGKNLFFFSQTRVEYILAKIAELVSLSNNFYCIAKNTSLRTVTSDSAWKSTALYVYMFMTVCIWAGVGASSAACSQVCHTCRVYAQDRESKEKQWYAELCNGRPSSWACGWDGIPFDPIGWDVINWFLGGLMPGRNISASGSVSTT